MGKIAFLFSGGGAQYPGMMKELYDELPAAHEIFQRTDDLLKKKLSDLCFYGDAQTLTKTENMIPAIFTADLAAHAALASYGIRAELAAGFSLGEWAAVTAAEAVPFEQSLPLVQFRSDAMAAATLKSSGAMAVIIGQPAKRVQELCTQTAELVWPANYNYPGMITVSGTLSGLDALEKAARQEKVIFKRLPVNVPSHCPLMQPAMEQLEQKLQTVDFSSPAFPIISNATALPEITPSKIKENITIQLIRPVLFEQSILYMFQAGIDTFIELGPGKTLTNFVKKIAKNHEVSSAKALRVENMETLYETLEALRA